MTQSRLRQSAIRLVRHVSVASPDANRVVVAAADEQLRVRRRPRHRVDDARVAGEALEELAALAVPNMDARVLAAAHDEHSHGADTCSSTQPVTHTKRTRFEVVKLLIALRYITNTSRKASLVLIEEIRKQSIAR